ncbi:MAG: ATP-binding protein [Bacilli bacterium]|nr:ATP-binding protein [Bacilli bacterium]
MGFLISYLEIVVEWVVELNIICFLLMSPLRKKKRFLLRFMGGFIISLVVALPLTLFYQKFGFTTWGRTLTYSLLWGITLASFFFSYDDSFMRVLLFADMGYIIQNLCYKVFCILWGILTYAGAFPESGPGALLFKVGYYSIFGLQVAAYYLILIRRSHRAISDKQPAKPTVLLSMVIMVILIVICSMIDIYGEKETGGAFTFPTYNSFVFKSGANLLLIVTDYLLLLLLFSSTRKNDLQYDVEQLNFLVSQSEKQYNISKDTIEMINIKCHDMRHRIKAILNEKNIGKDTYDDVKKAIHIYDSKINTGNSALDVILTEKSLLCGHDNITFTCMADGNAVSFMEQVDICCLFGNILDNAIEATKQVKEEDKRYILFSVSSIGNGMTKVECSNTYEIAPKKEGEIIVTSKNDKANHGFGIKSIKNIASKYDGSVEFKAEDSLFSVAIVLFNAEN